MRQECLHSLWISQEAALSCCPIEAPQALLLYPPPPAPTLPPLFFLSHLFFPLLLPVCVQCPGSDFCPAPLGSLYVLSVSLSLQGTVPKAFAARKISLTSEYTTYSRGGGGGSGLVGPQWVLTFDRGGRSSNRRMGCFGDSPHCRKKSVMGDVENLSALQHNQGL